MGPRVALSLDGAPPHSEGSRATRPDAPIGRSRPSAAPVTAKNAPPPSAHGPVRYARPPDLYEIVNALSPIEL